MTVDLADVICQASVSFEFVCHVVIDGFQDGVISSFPMLAAYPIIAGEFGRARS